MKRSTKPLRKPGSAQRWIVSSAEGLYPSTKSLAELRDSTPQPSDKTSDESGHEVPGVGEEPEEAPTPILAPPAGIQRLYAEVQKHMTSLADDGQLDWELALRADDLMKAGDVDGLSALLGQLKGA